MQKASTSTTFAVSPPSSSAEARAWVDQVKARMAEMPQLKYVPVISNALPEDNWTGRTGFVHKAVMEDHPDLSGFQVYACGAPIVVDSARAEYSAACKLPPEEFYADSFTSEADKHGKTA